MRDIKLCHPRLQQLAGKWVEECKNQGIVVKIGETLRTVAEQDALYAQGRTKPGSIVTNAPGHAYKSQHQWGIAYDFYLDMDVDGDGKKSDDTYNDSSRLFEKAGETAKRLGLGWGGDWVSITDKPHLYLPDWGSTPAKLIDMYHTPEKFIATWKPVEKKAGWIQTGYGWWYAHEDGTYTTNDWEKIDGKWYWFNEDGYAYRSQWVFYKEKWYYLGADNAMVTGLQEIENKIYYFEATGEMAVGEIRLETDDTGAIQVTKQES